MRTPVYLDHAATTPVRPEVLEAMLPYLTEQGFGNPSSAHRFGRAARAGIEQARREIALAVGAEPNQVIFTSGGTEADNLGIVGAGLAARANGASMCVVVSAIEHKAILAAAHAVCALGGREVVLPVDPTGRVDLEALDAALAGRPAVVSIMWVNNEVGVIQPVREIAGALQGRRRSLPHGRGAGVRQAAGLHERLPLHPAHALRPQDRSAQGHRRPHRARPQGGRGDHSRRRAAVRDSPRDRERGRSGRAGSCRGRSRPASSRRRRSRLCAPARRIWPSRLKATIGDLVVNGEQGERAPHVLNVSIASADSEAMLMHLDLAGVAASSGSACSTGAVEPSHVLVAMGVPRELALGAIRFSFGRESTGRRTSIHVVAGAMPEVVAKVRKLCGRSLGRV